MNETKTARPARSDVIGTAVLGIVGLIAAVMGIGYGITKDNGEIGAGFLPVVTGGFVVVASIAEIVRMYFARATTFEGSFMQVVEDVEDEARAAIGGAGSAEDGAPELDTFGRTEAQRKRTIVYIFAILLAAIVLIPLIGLLLSMSAMVLAILLAVERKPVVPSLIVTVAAFAVIYVIFVLGLNVPLPSGILALL